MAKKQVAVEEQVQVGNQTQVQEQDATPVSSKEVKISGADFHEVRLQFVDTVFNKYKKTVNEDEAAALYQEADQLLGAMKDMSEKAGRFGDWVAKATRNFANIHRNSALAKLHAEEAKATKATDPGHDTETTEDTAETGETSEA